MKLYQSCTVSEDSFPEHMSGQLFETIWRAEKLTVEMKLSEDGGESRNASEC
jgi:hypothetical protein